jgi:hypothetical protein
MKDHKSEEIPSTPRQLGVLVSQGQVLAEVTHFYGGVGIWGEDDFPKEEIL